MLIYFLFLTFLISGTSFSYVSNKQVFLFSQVFPYFNILSSFMFKVPLVRLHLYPLDVDMKNLHHTVHYQQTEKLCLVLSRSKIPNQWRRYVIHLLYWILLHEYVWDDEKATIINNKIKFIQIFDFPLNWWIVLKREKKWRKKKKIENLLKLITKYPHEIYLFAKHL